MGFETVKIVRGQKEQWVALAHAARAGDGGAEGAIRVLGVDANVPVHRGEGGEYIAVQAEGG